jgi:hypothetical protein
VLVITTSDQRLKNLRAAISKLTDKIFWFATLPVLAPEASGPRSGSGRPATTFNHSYEISSMRYCHNCHKTTTGERCSATSAASPTTPNSARPGTSIPAGRRSARSADRATSARPPRAIPFWLKPLLLALSLLPGVGLAALLVFVVVGHLSCHSDQPSYSSPTYSLLLILALLWWLYLQLPHFIKNMFRSLWHKPKKDRHTH